MRANDKYIFVDEDTLKLLKSIKPERKKRGLSLRQLADLTGITPQSLSRYENLIHSPVLENFLILAAFFNWDISNNINFLFTNYEKNLRYFRRFRHSHGFSRKEIQELTALTHTPVWMFFSGKGSILAFALISSIFDEEHRLTTFRQYLLRKKD